MTVTITCVDCNAFIKKIGEGKTEAEYIGLCYICSEADKNYKVNPQASNAKDK